MSLSVQEPEAAGSSGAGGCEEEIEGLESLGRALAGS